MTLRFSDVSIGLKIALACLVPLLGLAIFAGSAVIDAGQKAAAARDVLAAAELAEKTSLAVHELQRERGMSVGFVGSKGKDFAGDLLVQRKASDGRIDALRSASLVTAHTGTLGGRLNAAGAELSALEKLRRDVDALALPGGQAAAAYTKIIASLIVTIEAIGELAQDSAIAGTLSVYTAGIRGKELAGQERASGARGFAAGRFGACDLRGFVALGGRTSISTSCGMRRPRQDALREAQLASSAEVARARGRDRVRAG